MTYRRHRQVSCTKSPHAQPKHKAGADNEKRYDADAEVTQFLTGIHPSLRRQVARVAEEMPHDMIQPRDIVARV